MSFLLITLLTKESNAAITAENVYCTTLDKLTEQRCRCDNIEGEGGNPRTFGPVQTVRRACERARQEKVHKRSTSSDYREFD